MPNMFVGQALLTQNWSTNLSLYQRPTWSDYPAPTNLDFTSYGLWKTVAVPSAKGQRSVLEGWKRWICRWNHSIFRLDQSWEINIFHSQKSPVSLVEPPFPMLFHQPPMVKVNSQIVQKRGTAASSDAGSAAARGPGAPPGRMATSTLQNGHKFPPLFSGEFLGSLVDLEHLSLVMSGDSWLGMKIDVLKNIDASKRNFFVLWWSYGIFLIIILRVVIVIIRTSFYKPWRRVDYGPVIRWILANPFHILLWLKILTSFELKMRKKFHRRHLRA